MHPLVTAAAGVWGVPPEELGARVAGVALGTALPPRAVEALVREYYRGRPLPAGFEFYDCFGRSPAVVWKRPEAPVLEESVALVTASPRADARGYLEAGIACLARLTRSGAQLWNDEILRLHALEFIGGTAHAEFSLGRFFDYRFTTGLLGEEALNGGHALRDLLMPAMTGFDERFTAGGLQALVAIARPAPFDDFAIPLQVRSGRVSDGHGLYGVIPMAYHQPVLRNGWMDARGMTSAWRELAEELCGLEERGGLEEDQTAAFESLPEIAALQREAVIEITGFTLNLVNGNYDYNILICQPDPAYWEKYALRWSPNWEAERTLMLSSREHGAFHRLITQEDWVPQSLVSLCEGLDRLRAIDPSRCGSPKK